MTAEEKVKAKWPDAVCVGHESEGWIIVTANKTLTSMEKRTQALAWEDAARRIRGGER